MYSKEILSRYIEIAAYINSKYGTLTISIHIILLLALTFSAYNSFKKPRSASSNLLKIIISITYMYGGFFFLFGYNIMSFKELLSLSGMIVIGLAALLLLLMKKTTFQLSDKLDLRILGIFFMIGGAIAYPFIEMLTGLPYPGIVLIGAECPTTTFFNGLLIACLPTVNRYLSLCIFIYSITSGVSAVAVGAYVDVIYSLSGIFGIIMIIKYRKLIFIWQG
jgi:hypothetical protein